MLQRLGTHRPEILRSPTVPLNQGFEMPLNILKGTNVRRRWKRVNGKVQVYLANLSLPGEGMLRNVFYD